MKKKINGHTHFTHKSITRFYTLLITKVLSILLIFVNKILIELTVLFYCNSYQKDK